MDYLKSIFGGEKSKQSQLETSQQSQPKEKLDKANINSISAERTENNKDNQSKIELRPSLDRWDTLEKSFRDAAKRVIPLEDNDCLSCKLIGTTVLWGCSAFILSAGFKFKRTQTGFKKVTSFMGYSTFAFGLFLLGTARLFDLSVFNKNTDKTLAEMTVEDFQKLKSLFIKEPKSKE